MSASSACRRSQGIFRRKPVVPSAITADRRPIGTKADAAAAAKAPYRLDEATGRLFAANPRGDRPRFQTVVGLEIHAQLDVPTKLFSPGRPLRHLDAVSTRPNSAVDTPACDGGGGGPALHPLDVAVPGFLPVISKEAVHAALLAASLLRCEIPPVSRFERKHYAYADLPFHYQVTQQRWPLAVNGQIEAFIAVNHKKQKGQSAVRCRVNRIQLEQDTGKTIQGSSFGSPIKHLQKLYTTSSVDFNRAGQALIEIVLEPDLRTPQEASTVTDALRQLLKHVGVCDGHMEEGSLRCDVNVNIEEVSPPVPSNDNYQQQDRSPPRRRSPRVEIKNLNSISQVRDAIRFEVLRQAREWDDGPEQKRGASAAETRTWNPIAKATELLRKKDQEQDYRFMPEPDLPPLVLNEEMLDGLDLPTFLKTRMPELPSQAIDRLKNEYGISDYLAGVIATDIPAIRFFERAVDAAMAQLERLSIKADRLHVSPLIAGYLTREIFFLVKENESDASVQDSHVSSEQLGQVVALHLSGKFSSSSAGHLLKMLYRNEQGHGGGGDPAQLAAKLGLELIQDPEKIRAICNRVLDENPEQLEQYLEGETKVVKFFNGMAMKACNRNAEPETLLQIVEEVLEERLRRK